MQNFKSEFDWDLARVFLAVAREGQLLGAARKLGLDQATVTRRINTLEAALGVRLFDRGTSGSELTREGRAFLEHAVRIESETIAIRSTFAPGDGHVAGTVRIGAPDGFGTLFLAGRFAALLDAHPKLAVQLVPLPRAFSLSKREADIAITVERAVEGRLRVRKLTDYTLSLYASADYLAHKPAPKSKSDLAGHRLITYVGDLLFTSALDFTAVLDMSAQPQFQCASVLGQIEAVRSGLGIGLLHDYAARADTALVRILPKVCATRTYWIVTHADSQHVRQVRAVQDHIVAEVEACKPMFTRLPRGP